MLFEAEPELDRSQDASGIPVYSGVSHGLLYGIMQFLRSVEIDGHSA